MAEDYRISWIDIFPGNQYFFRWMLSAPSLLMTKNMHVKDWKGIKRTAFAKSLGYSSTSQLSVTLEGEAMISTKAIIELIKNFNINPTYLFTGQGEMFLPDESEMESLRLKYSELERKFFANQDDLFKCKAELERAIYRYNKLIDITSIALDKSQKIDLKEEIEVKTKKNE